MQPVTKLPVPTQQASQKFGSRASQAATIYSRLFFGPKSEWTTRSGSFRSPPLMNEISKDAHVTALHPSKRLRLQVSGLYLRLMKCLISALMSAVPLWRWLDSLTALRPVSTRDRRFGWSWQASHLVPGRSLARKLAAPTRGGSCVLINPSDLRAAACTVSNQLRAEPTSMLRSTRVR